MAIVKVVCIDPKPRKHEVPRALIYQVPDHSREMGLLQSLFDRRGIEYEVMSNGRKRSDGGRGHVRKAVKK